MMRGILVRAMEDQTPIEIIYLTKDGSISQRLIRVMDLKDGQIKAYCYLRNKYRVFNLQNILSIFPVNKKYRGA
jgi:predicted DNA-binding transcriptional regulator YafY